jgi:kynurenine formamidase
VSPADLEWRAEFDAEVTFANGGGLQAQGFRLDIPSDSIEETELRDLFVRHLGLLMVSDVRFASTRVFPEAHKGSRGALEHRRGSLGRGTEVIDLTHEITAGMVTVPGIPGPEVGEHVSREASRAQYAAGTEFSIGRVSMIANTGTYLDSPFHRFEGGLDLAHISLASTVDLEGVLVRLTGMMGRAIHRNALATYDVAGRAVLLHTGWERNWGTPDYGSGHPYITAEAGQWLVENHATLVGIDSVNVDDTDGGERPVHTALLGANIAIVEHLTGLDRLPIRGFRFHAAPLPIVGLGTSPVRAYAVLDGSSDASATA